MIFGRIKAYLFAGIAGLLALGGLLLAVFTKGRASREKDVQRAQNTAVNAEADAVQAQAVAKAATTSAMAVAATAKEVAAMPDAGAQKVAQAAEGTAADWLKQNANRDHP